jgi:hypothetical protein
MQDYIQLKLSKLKEVIGKSVNVKKEVKDTLTKVAVESIEAEVSTLSMDQAFKLYQARYHFLEMRGTHNESFGNVVKKLAEADKSIQLIITILQVENDSYIVFTDNEYMECFGIIY